MMVFENPLFLGAIGAGLAVGIAGLGSGIGAGITGASGAGVVAEDPNKFGTAIVFQALPQTQGLYVITSYSIHYTKLYDVYDRIRRIENLLESGDWTIKVEALQSVRDFINEGHYGYLDLVMEKLDDPHWKVKNAALGILRNNFV